MCGKRSCGKMVGSTPLKDTRTGTNRTVQTGANLAGNKPMLKDQRGMNQTNLNVKNPLSGKR